MKSQNMKKSKISLIICLIFSISLTLLLVQLKAARAAQSDDQRMAKLVEGAKREGKLVWYCSISSGEGEKLLQRFKKMYPFVETGLYRAGTVRMRNKIEAEIRARRNLFDVVLMGGTDLEALNRKGIFAKHTTPHQKFYPEGCLHPDRYWTSINVVINIIAYNTKLVPAREAPQNWTDLVDPKWKGKMGMDTKAFYWLASLMKSMGEEKGLEYVEKLSQQNIKFRTGRTLNAQLLSAGEYSVGIALYNQRIEELKGKGAPIEWVAINPAIPGFNHIAISTDAPHPNTARLFYEFMLSKESQKMLASFFRIPTRTDVDAIVPRLKEGLTLLPFDFDIVDNYTKYIKLYRKVLMKKK